jgi:hypothetical protein
LTFVEEHTGSSYRPAAAENKKNGSDVILRHWQQAEFSKKRHPVTDHHHNDDHRPLGRARNKQYR